MQRIVKFYFFILLFSLLACGGSGNDEPKQKEVSIDMEKLQGNWKVTAASRAGQSTRLLSNVVFSFFQDTLETNLPTINSKNTYELKQNRIITPTHSYRVHAYAEKQLVLSIELQNTPFDLTLERIMNSEK